MTTIRKKRPMFKSHNTPASRLHRTSDQPATDWKSTNPPAPGGENKQNREDRLRWTKPRNNS